MARRIPDPPPIIIQRLTEAFNKQDLDTILGVLAVNVVVAVFNGGTETVGAPTLKAIYEEMFAEQPKPRLSVTGRLSQGDQVAQQEVLTRGLTVVERRIAIYTVLHEKVTRVDLIR
jgi:hypothetical protein